MIWAGRWAAVKKVNDKKKRKDRTDLNPDSLLSKMIPTALSSPAHFYPKYENSDWMRRTEAVESHQSPVLRKLALPNYSSGPEKSAAQRLDNL